MTKTIIIGDGPGGLSAALFLAKNGVETLVFAQDKTAMHWAYLYNYLGIPEIDGTAFMKVARKQVADFGAELCDEEVSGIAQHDGGFKVTTNEGDYEGDYLIIAEGKGAKLSQAVGLKKGESGIAVDCHGRSGIERLYVVGRATRITRSQAIISAGEGAAAALDILSAVHGKEFNDFDTPPDES